MTSKIIPIILAGGSGTRLWPLSRKNYPKQFLRLHGEYSLLQQTLKRVQSLSSEKQVIMTSDAHYFLCQEQLQSLSNEVTYLLEPCPRNTAPAIAAAAHYLAAREGEDAIMLVLPSDHWIGDESAWRDAMLQGVDAACSAQALVTFGIKPDSPKTGYGYIEVGNSTKGSVGLSVQAFREKPDVMTAEYFLQQGNYYWNSGMFVGQVSTWLSELQQFAPDVYHQSAEAVTHGQALHDFFRMDSADFGRCRNESIDYAIMEKTSQALVIPVDMQWSDLGCWASVAEASLVNAEGNVLTGDVIAKDSINCFIRSEHGLVTALGIQDQIIVSTHDAVLVADKRYAQQVKEIVSTLSKDNNVVADEHLQVHRPWGYFEILAEGETFKVKRLMVKPGAKLSLQMHQHRAEHWVVVGGIAEVINDDAVFQLQVNQSTYISPKTRHRLGNPGKEPLYVIEVQSGSYLGEDDIVRFDDVYYRDLTAP